MVRISEHAPSRARHRCADNQTRYASRKRVVEIAIAEVNTETSVLIFSMRQVARLVGYCSAYEFEDVISDVTGADRIEAKEQTGLDTSRRIYKYTRLLFGSKALGRIVTPAPHLRRLHRGYKLFFPVFNHPHELYALATLPEWRKHCEVAACFIAELWPHLLPDYLLELLEDFDHVFVGSVNVAEHVARVTGKPCTYIPSGVDVLNFAPHPMQPHRTIDVSSIGRRSSVTHCALLKMAQERGLFYFYDTVAASGVDLKQRTFQVHNPAEHRHLLGQLLRRTRYYIANRARANEPEYTVAGDEISARFYEGAAAGAVMIGDIPRCHQFDEQFDWPDAVIQAPFDAPDIGALIDSLDQDSARIERIRRNNIHFAALRHDWLYRVQDIFHNLKLPDTQRMDARAQRLRSIAATFAMPHNAVTAKLPVPRLA
jgi:hypothetical protein